MSSHRKGRNPSLSAESGEIFLWRYRRPPQGWPPIRGVDGYHITANVRGCDYLLAKLRPLETAQKPGTLMLRPMKVSREVLSVPNTGQVAVSLQKFTIEVSPRWGLDHFRFSESYPNCWLELSRRQVRIFRECVEDIRNGGGDYCIGDDEGDISNVLWFWFHPDVPPNDSHGF